jgi:Flp pilus assembly protein TadD
MAVSELERAVLKGNDPVWKYHLAMAYAKAGDLNRGRATLQAALKLNPNIPEAKLAQEVLGAAK